MTVEVKKRFGVRRIPPLCAWPRGASSAANVTTRKQPHTNSKARGYRALQKLARGWDGPERRVDHELPGFHRWNTDVKVLLIVPARPSLNRMGLPMDLKPLFQTGRQLDQNCRLAPGSETGFQQERRIIHHQGRDSGLSYGPCLIAWEGIHDHGLSWPMKKWVLLSYARSSSSRPSAGARAESMY